MGPLSFWRSSQTDGALGEADEGGEGQCGLDVMLDYRRFEIIEKRVFVWWIADGTTTAERENAFSYTRLANRHAFC